MSDNHTLQESIENTIKNEQYKFFENWVDNFGLNLEHIWNESSAGELSPSIDPLIENNSAIVIGIDRVVSKNTNDLTNCL